MYRNCHLPANMTEGSEVKTFGEEWESDPLQALKECFAYLSSKGQDDGFLILATLYESFDDMNLRKDLKCQCKDEYLIISRIGLALLLQELGRDKPLFHLQEMGEYYFTSGRDQIKMHMTKPKPKQDLVCDRDLAKGYESEKVIICNNVGKEHLSRASIVGVEVTYNQKALIKYGFDWIQNNPHHKCGEIFKSDNELLQSKNLSRSETLQSNQDYSNDDSNPILACLEDQCKYDPELKGAQLNQSKLLKLMIEGLEKKTIHLRCQKLGLEDSPDWLIWLSEMKSRRNHYSKESKSADFEALLLDLASQLLKRKITLFIHGLN